MMIIADQIKYDIIAVLGDGTRLFLTDSTTKFGWEEPEKELAVRVNLTLIDTKYEGKLLSQWLPLCSRIYLMADWGTGTMHEVFRGGIWTTKPSGIENDPLQVTSYDDLYYLQKSNESNYWSAGTNTKTIITGVLSNWSIPFREYKGPTETHEKLVVKSKAIAATLLQVLGDAKKLGGPECIIRMSEGKADILPIGSNSDVYVFTPDNSYSPSQEQSMTDLVTRVIIQGKEDSAGRPKVEATVDGKTEYGIIQQIVDKNSDSIEKAKEAANDILDENGSPSVKSILQSVDLPFLRKGDKIYAQIGMLNGYATIKSISHDAKSMSMQMEVTPIK